MSEDDRERGDAESGPDEEAFLSRWSRLKQASRDRVPAPVGPPDDARAGEVVPEAEAEPEPPSDEDLPDPEALDDDADFSAYLSPKVSEDLRRRALRRMFRNPIYNVRDGLDDYQFDYRNFLPLGDTKTADLAGKIAKGLVKRLENGGWADTEEVAALAAANDPRPETRPDTATETAPEGPDSRSGDDTPQESDTNDNRDT